jgi:hypothetical protein
MAITKRIREKCRLLQPHVRIEARGEKGTVIRQLETSEGKRIHVRWDTGEETRYAISSLFGARILKEDPQEVPKISAEERILKIACDITSEIARQGIRVPDFRNKMSATSLITKVRSAFPDTEATEEQIREIVERYIDTFRKESGQRMRRKT